MSVSTSAQSPQGGASLAKFWFAILLLAAIGIGLAWLGSGSMRGETLPSGLTIRTIEEGAGPTVGPNDGVLIEYVGRFEDGTVFDSSGGRGPVPIIPSQTIPGFAEAMSHMQNGGRYNIKIPSDLAYGASPPQGIPPNANLDFDVHVVQIVPNAAAAGGGIPQPQASPQPQAQPQGQ